MPLPVLGRGQVLVYHDQPRSLLFHQLRPSNTHLHCANLGSLFLPRPTFISGQALATVTRPARRALHTTRLRRELERRRGEGERRRGGVRERRLLRLETGEQLTSAVDRTCISV